MSKDLPAKDRRREIIAAAVEVFAERGFHRTRVSDIAKKAGVAYGLIYHYFDSKQAVLDCIFRDNWGILVRVLQDLHEDESSTAGQKLGAVSDALVDGLAVAPKVIQVILHEIARSERFGQEAAFKEAFLQLEAILRDGQEKGEVALEIDPKVAAYTYFGALEATCTGFILGAVDCSTPEATASLKASLRHVVLSGLEPRAA